MKSTSTLFSFAFAALAPLVAWAQSTTPPPHTQAGATAKEAPSRGPAISTRAAPTQAAAPATKTAAPTPAAHLKAPAMHAQAPEAHAVEPHVTATHKASTTQASTSHGAAPPAKPTAALPPLHRTTAPAAKAGPAHGASAIPGGGVDAHGAAIPNHRFTPGAVLTTKVSDIEKPDWAKNHRDLTQAEKDQINTRYNFHGDSSTVEYDHLISLELGGSNDLKNIWPEPIAQARVKDKLEDWLHAQVIAGKIALVSAQHGIAGDWNAYARQVGAPADCYTVR